MSGYWLKVYAEILEDPKYFKLSDAGKLAMFEIMTVVKKTEIGERAGRLPETEDIAFFTRRPVEWWNDALMELKNIRFIVEGENGLIIRKWTDRQNAVDPAERQRRSRAARAQREFHPVTNRDNNSNDSVTFRDGEYRVQSTENRVQSTERTTTAQSASEDFEISSIQRMLEKITGIMPSNQNDLKALESIEAMNPTIDDVRAGFDWLQGQGMRIYHYSSLVNPIKVAQAQRVQKQHTEPRRELTPAFDYCEGGA